MKGEGKVGDDPMICHFLWMLIVLKQVSCVVFLEAFTHCSLHDVSLHYFQGGLITNCPFWSSNRVFAFTAVGGGW